MCVAWLPSLPIIVEPRQPLLHTLRGWDSHLEHPFFFACCFYPISGPLYPQSLVPSSLGNFLPLPEASSSLCEFLNHFSEDLQPSRVRIPFFELRVKEIWVRTLNLPSLRDRG